MLIIFFTYLHRLNAQAAITLITLRQMQMMELAEKQQLSGSGLYLRKLQLYKNCNIYMHTQINCTSCLHPIYRSSPQYYCCNNRERYCIICKGKNCKRCDKKVQKPYQIPKCKICYSTCENDSFYEPYCNINYCSKCIVTRLLGSSSNQPMLTLPCRHEVQRDVLNNIIKGYYCKNCGKKYNPLTDFDLQDGHKWCSQCFRWQSIKVKNILNVCISCDKIIRLNKEISNSVEGFIVCLICAKNSEFEQHLCEKQKQKKQAKRVQTQKNVNNYSESINSNSPNNNNLKRNMMLHKTGQNSFTIKVNQPPIKEKQQKYQNQILQQNEKKGHSRENKKGQSPEVKQYKKSISKQKVPAVLQQVKFKSPPKPLVNVILSPKNEQKKDVVNQLPEASKRKTILNRFPSQKDSNQRELPKIGLKKHLSIDTYIQKLKIQIDLQEGIKTIVCTQCGYQLQQKNAFNVQNSLNEYHWYCRLCYINLNNTQSLGFHKSTPEKIVKSRNDRAASNQYKILIQSGSKPSSKNGQQVTVNSLQPSRFATQFKQINRNLPPLPESRKNLLGNQTIMTHKANYNNFGGRVYDNSKTSGYQEKVCTVCQNSGRSFILTQDRGQVCLSCYYNKKNRL